MSETMPEPTQELPTAEQTPVFRFGLPGGWGLMAHQLEIEAEESFEGTKSLDKLLIRFSEIDPDETFRL
jgi:hypothetical protein